MAVNDDGLWYCGWIEIFLPIHFCFYFSYFNESVYISSIIQKMKWTIYSRFPFLHATYLILAVLQMPIPSFYSIRFSSLMLSSTQPHSTPSASPSPVTRQSLFPSSFECYRNKSITIELDRLSDRISSICMKYTCFWKLIGEFMYFGVLKTKHCWTNCRFFIVRFVLLCIFSLPLWLLYILNM